MRDAQRLPKLSTSHRLLHQLCEEGVRVIVKAFHVRACQNQKRVGRASEIEFRSTAIVDAMKVADRKRRLGTFALIQNALRAEENISQAIGCSAYRRKVRGRLRRSQELDSPRHGELHHFIEAVAGLELGRIASARETGLELKIADLRERCR